MRAGGGVVGGGLRAQPVRVVAGRVRRRTQRCGEPALPVRVHCGCPGRRRARDVAVGARGGSRPGGDGGRVCGVRGPWTPGLAGGADGRRAAHAGPRRCVRMGTGSRPARCRCRRVVVGEGLPGLVRSSGGRARDHEQRRRATRRPDVEHHPSAGGRAARAEPGGVTAAVTAAVRPAPAVRPAHRSEPAPHTASPPTRARASRRTASSLMGNSLPMDNSPTASSSTPRRTASSRTSSPRPTRPSGRVSSRPRRSSR